LSCKAEEYELKRLPMQLLREEGILSKSFTHTNSPMWGGDPEQIPL